jgi:NTE family protein
MADKLKNYELMDADIVIFPDVGDLHWSEFSQAKILIEEGERAARENLDNIRHAMPSEKRWFTFTQLLGSHRKKEQ